MLVTAGDAWIPLGETLRKSGNQPWDISILLFVGKKNKQYLDWQKYMFERKKIPSKPTTDLSELSALPPVIAFARHAKLQRTAAYSQEQCLWAGIKTSTGHTLSQFEVPPGFVIRPVAMGETRMLEDDPKDPTLSDAYFQDQFVFVCNVVGLVSGRSAC